MKIFSKTLGKEVDVECIEKEQDGQMMVVIKHASLQNLIYNELGIGKDPDCIRIEDARPHSPYPVYKCTIWDKERERCVVGIGSGKPATLTTKIANNYADESASNRAFDRAAILYLQIPARQLSEEEVGIFLPEDITPTINSTPNIQDNDQDIAIVEAPLQIPDMPTYEDDGEEEEFKDAPIVDVKSEPQPEPETVATEEIMTAPTEPDPEPEKAADDNGDYIIDFGKYGGNATPLRDIVADPMGLEWAKKCAKIQNPNPKIADKINVIKDYLAANNLI
jgi:hypothetical protein